MDELFVRRVTGKMGLCFARKSTGTRRGEGVGCGVWEIACLISFRRREVIGWRNGKRCDGCVYKTFWEEIFLLLLYHTELEDCLTFTHNLPPSAAKEEKNPRMAILP